MASKTDIVIVADRSADLTQPLLDESTYDASQTIWQRYDNIFLFTYLVQSFNGGMRFLFMLAQQDLYKNYYRLQPGHAQILTTICFAPAIIKFVYGVVADSIPICGSRKKAWLILMGSLQCTCLMVVACVTIESADVAAVFLFMVQLAVCFADVVMDAMMVIESRKNPKVGSQELLSFAWIVQAISAVIGAVCASFLLQYQSPFYCFFIYALAGAGQAIVGIFVPQYLEEDQATLEARNSGRKRTFR